MPRYQIRMSIVVEAANKEEAAKKGKKLERIFNRETHALDASNTMTEQGKEARKGVLFGEGIWSNRVLEVLPYEYD